MRINAIGISWFRGAADLVFLEPECKSMVVYGSNASGKSSFVDAIEYVLNEGRITHLAHEYSGKHLKKAIPNTHKPKGAKAKLVINFCDKSDIKLEFDDDGSTKNSGSMLAAIGMWDYRRTVLRQDEVAAFIQDTKGGKYSALLPLLGLHPMEIAAENLRQVVRNVASLSNVEHIKAVLRQARVDRETIFGMISDNEVRNRIELLHLKYCPDKVANKDGVSRCADLALALEAQIERLSSDQKRYLSLRTIAELELKKHLEAVRAASVSLAGAVDPLIAQKLAVLLPTEILIRELSGEGEVECPACGQFIRVDMFREHVRFELERLREIRDAFNQRNVAMGILCDTVKSLKRELGKSELKSWRDERTNGGLAEFLIHLDGLQAERLRSVCGEKDLQEMEGKMLPIIETAALSSVDAPPDVKQLWGDKRLVGAAEATFKASDQAAEVVRVETLISLLAALEQACREEIRLRSKAVVDEISTDVRDMWEVLHPQDAIENVHLYLPEDADKAIDIGLRFHGKDLDSPRLTLSEGYRNSLGLCIFLAMAKREAASDRPVFLDDVVVSLDRGHRGMVICLLEKYFSTRQIILLTHDRDWYAELRQLLNNGPWVFKALLPYDTPTIGIRWSHKTTTFDDARAQLNARPDSAANDARKIMDVELALIAERVQLKLPYLRLDKNDKRMAHDFLERLIADAERCFQKASGKDFVSHRDAIEAMKNADRFLISWANRGSHSFDVVRAESAKLIDACEKALGFFKCDLCGKSVGSADAHGPEFTQCQCGGIRWRYGKG